MSNEIVSYNTTNKRRASLFSCSIFLVILVLVDERRAVLHKYIYTLRLCFLSKLISISLGGFSFRREHSMHALISRRLRRLPSALLQEVLVLELIHLDVQGTTDLDHLFLAVASKAPEGEITAGTSACEKKKTSQLAKLVCFPKDFGSILMES